jgi:hypothetical protein
MESEAPFYQPWRDEVLALPSDELTPGFKTPRLADLEARARAYGEFVASVAPWTWFMTFTFRQPVAVTVDAQKSSAPYKPPVVLPRERLVRDLSWYLDRMARDGGTNSSWMLAEEFGRRTGRWHCHGLAAVRPQLHSGRWWWEAYQRWGYTRIEKARHAATVSFYAAKYVTKSLGEIHFGGVAMRRFERDASLRQLAFDVAGPDGHGQFSLPGIPAPLSAEGSGLEARAGTAAAAPDVYTADMFRSDMLPRDFFHLSHVRQR